MNRASDSGGPRRPVNLVTEHAGDSCHSEVCVQGQETKDVFEDGFSDEPRHMSRMDSTGICIHDHDCADDEKILTEVMIDEGNWKRPKPFAELDGSSEKRQQVMAIPIDCFLETRNTEDSTSVNTAKSVDVPHGEEFVAYREEMTVPSSQEILEFIDKHDTAEVVVNATGSDFVIPEVSSSHDSAHHGFQNEYSNKIRQEQSTPEFSGSSVAKRLREDVVGEWQETQDLVIENNSNLPEAASNDEYREQIVGLSDEALDSVCEVAGLPLDFVCENISENVAVTNTPDREIKEDLIQNKRVESSTSASSLCDFANNHWRILEELDGFANEENIREDSSPETSVCEMVEDEGVDDTCASMIAARSEVHSTVWWNLCGVLDVFAEGDEN